MNVVPRKPSNRSTHNAVHVFECFLLIPFGAFQRLAAAPPPPPRSRRGGRAPQGEAGAWKRKIPRPRKGKEEWKGERGRGAAEGGERGVAEVPGILAHLLPIDSSASLTLGLHGSPPLSCARRKKKRLGGERGQNRIANWSNLRSLTSSYKARWRARTRSWSAARATSTRGSPAWLGMGCAMSARATRGPRQAPEPRRGMTWRRGFSQ